MRPIEFPEQTTVWAKNQPPFLPLPAFSNREETITLWQLTWRERFALLVRGRLWHRQVNFGAPLQALMMEVDSPFDSRPATRRDA